MRVADQVLPLPNAKPVALRTQDNNKGGYIDVSMSKIAKLCTANGFSKYTEKNTGANLNILSAQKRYCKYAVLSAR